MLLTLRIRKKNIIYLETSLLVNMPFFKLKTATHDGTLLGNAI